MRNYDAFFESLTPTFYDEEEHQRERVAERQMQLDILYRIGCQYNIKQADIALICQLASIPLDELMNYSGVTV